MKRSMVWRVAPDTRLLAAAAAVLLVWGCSDRGESPVGSTDDVEVTVRAGLVVSEPVDGSGSTVSGAATEGADVTYVSAQPGTFPNAVSVQIRNVTTDDPLSAPVPVVEGGFDPVAVQASVGDRLGLAVLEGGGGVTVLYVAVPPRRPPLIVRTIPPRGRVDVALSVQPRVVFSEPIDPASVTATSIRLLRDGEPVEGSVGLVPGSPFTAELAPGTLLQPLTDYELVVSTDVRDLDGDALEAELRVVFTTEAHEGLSLVSGTNQPGRAGRELAEPFVVRVTDAQGAGVEDVEVTWTVASGEGVLDGLWTRCDDVPGTPGWDEFGDPIPTASVRTDAAGLARIAFMPTWFGPVTVRAEAPGVPGGPVTFTTDASDPGATLEIRPSLDEGPWIWAYQNHNRPLVVSVKDGQGEDVPYVPVSWRVESGAGVLFGGCSRFDPTALTSRTHVHGWSPDTAVDFLPRVYGPSTVSAAIPGVQGSPVTFTMDATRVLMYVGEQGFVGPHFSGYGEPPSSHVTVPVGASVEFLVSSETAHVVSTSTPPGGEAFDSGMLTKTVLVTEPMFGFVPNVPGTWEFVDLVGGTTGTVTAISGSGAVRSVDATPGGAGRLP